MSIEDTVHHIVHSFDQTLVFLLKRQDKYRIRRFYHAVIRVGHKQASFDAFDGHWCGLEWAPTKEALLEAVRRIVSGEDPTCGPNLVVEIEYGYWPQYHMEDEGLPEDDDRPFGRWLTICQNPLRIVHQLTVQTNDGDEDLRRQSRATLPLRQ